MQEGPVGLNRKKYVTIWRKEKKPGELGLENLMVSFSPILIVRSPGEDGTSSNIVQR